MTALWIDRYQHGRGKLVRHKTLVPEREVDEDVMIDRAVEQSLADGRPIIAYTLLTPDAVNDKGPQLEIGVWGKGAAGFWLYNEPWNGLAKRGSWISVGKPAASGPVTYWVDDDQEAVVPMWAHLPLDDIRTCVKVFGFKAGRPSVSDFTVFPPATNGGRRA